MFCFVCVFVFVFVFLGAGYFVFVVNFHGSSGYGQDFVDSVTGHWASKPAFDIAMGVKSLLSEYVYLSLFYICINLFVMDVITMVYFIIISFPSFSLSYFFFFFFSVMNMDQ